MAQAHHANEGKLGAREVRRADRGTVRAPAAAKGARGAPDAFGGSTVEAAARMVMEGRLVSGDLPRIGPYAPKLEIGAAGKCGVEDGLPVLLRRQKEVLRVEPQHRAGTPKRAAACDLENPRLSQGAAPRIRRGRWQPHLAGCVRGSQRQAGVRLGRVAERYDRVEDLQMRKPHHAPRNLGEGRQGCLCVLILLKPAEPKCRVGTVAVHVVRKPKVQRLRVRRRPDGQQDVPVGQRIRIRESR